MLRNQVLNIDTPWWGEPFLEPMKYKGLKGSRSSGKSHFFAELAVEEMMKNPHTDFVCLREVQKSLKFSAKKLVEKKIYEFGASSMFKILDNEIRRLGRNGMITGRMIFEGMNDHTADSIKSLEDFNRAWFEEAQRASKRSIKLLRPTMRTEGCEMWFSWNPDQETDPIEQFLVVNPPENSIVAHVNFEQNLFCPETIKEEARIWLRDDPDTYDHVWGGGYNTKSDDQVLGGKYVIEDFIIQPHWDGPYYGIDWGFAVSPNVIIECYVDPKTNIIYVTREVWGLHVEIDDTPAFFKKMTGCEKYVIRADSARPEMVDYTKRHGFPRVRSAEKWPGSVEDGISKLRSFHKIIIHTQCPRTALDARLYKHKRDRLTDDILPDIIKKHDDCIDALRYAIEPLTKRKRQSFFT